MTHEASACDTYRVRALRFALAVCSLCIAAGCKRAALDTPRVVDDASASSSEVSLEPDASAPAAAVGPRLLEVAPWISASTARVVLRLSEPVNYRSGDFEMGKSLRSYIDLDGISLPPTGAAQRETQGLVRGIRVEATRAGGRVSFDVLPGTYKRAFHLTDPFRVVIDFLPQARAMPNARLLRRVVIDAGHGGEDPGALGPGRTREKDVALDVALRAGRVLVGKGVEVVLTRSDDTFVPLEERAARANAAEADLFLSVHCNAAENDTAKGFEVYVLDVDSGRVAGRIARRENGLAAGAGSEELGGMLAQMRLADGGSRARHFADLIERGVHASLRAEGLQRHNGGVHGAAFHVLVGARMPAVLAELGYITTPSEERRLGEPLYRQKMAEGLANAVLAYKAGK